MEIDHSLPREFPSLVPKVLSMRAAPHNSSLSILYQGLTVPILLILLSGILPGQCATGTVEIFGVSGGDYLGRSVAISGGRLFAGAIGDDSGGMLSGSVRVFRKSSSGYQLEQLLPGEVTSEFGASLAVDGNRMAAGATGNGSVVIFERVQQTWTTVQVLFDPGAQVADGFGSSVKLAGDTLVVGSPNFETGAGPVGCVTIWKLDSAGVWEFHDRLLASDRVPGDQFGTALDLDGPHRLIVGAPGRDHLGPDTGAAYYFTGTAGSWIEEFSIGSGAANPGDRLGTSVAVSEDHILLGAPYSDLGGSAAGAVVHYHREGQVWVLGPYLLPPSGASGCAFGAILDLDGNLLSIGAPTDTGAEAFPSGSASIFRWQGGWQLLDVQVGNPSSFLGSSVAVHRGVVVIGAPFASTNAPAGGNIVVKIYGDTDCDQDGVSDACSIAAGSDSDCDLDGIPDGCGIGMGVSEDCDGDGIPDLCTTRDGIVADCDGDGIPDSCAVAAGQVMDCDGNGIPDLCQVDCNQNLIPDVCEILSDGTLDCDADGLLDSCELLEGSEEDCDDNAVIDSCDPDCNENMIPDSCDFLAGNALDCNSNHIPDSCDLEMPSNDVNGNGELDECEIRFIRGDADGVQGIRLADAVLLIGRVFGENSIPGCLEAADANADGSLDISDGISLLYYLYAGGTAPPPPFPDCGIIPAGAFFPCDDHPTCP